MRRLVLTAGIVGGFVTSLFAADMARAGDVTVQQPWARASIGNTKNSAAYMVLEVTGEQADRLIAVASPLAAKAQLHAHLMEDGVAKMRPVEAIDVAPGTSTVLEPGGLHVMLMGLSQKLEEGATIPLTLTFANAGEVTVEVPVHGLRGGMGDGGHGSMDHGGQTTTN